MKAPASFLGSFLVVAIRSRSFPNPTTAISSINLSKRSSQRLLCLCCDNTFCTLMSRKTPSKLSDSVPFSARRAFMSQDSGEMKQPTLYEVLVRKLYMTNMFNPVKLGLKNMEDLHNLLNKPMDRVSSTMWCVNAILLSLRKLSNAYLNANFFERIIF